MTFSTLNDKKRVTKTYGKIFYTIINLLSTKIDILCGMKYKEYLDTARRHLESCQCFFYSINWSETLTKERILKANVVQLKEEKKLLKDKHKLIAKKTSLIEQTNNWTSEKKILAKWLERRKKRIEFIRTSIRQREEEIELIDNTKQLKEKNLLEDIHSLLTKKASLIEQINYWKCIRRATEERLLRRKTRIETKKILMSQKENLLGRVHNELIRKEEWLKKKQSQLKEKELLLKDIFYLSGYIFESFIVFKIYEVGYRHVRDIYRERGIKFDPDKYDVTDFIKEFTEFTRVDYYPRKVTKNGQVILRRTGTKRHNGKWSRLDDDEKEFLENIEGLCAIEQHKFQELFRMIQNNQVLRDAMFPQSTNIPLFFVNASPEVENLINSWCSGVRYSDPSVWENIKNYINESTLKDLLNICQQINEKITQF